MKPQPIDLEMLMRVPHVDPDLGFDIHPDGTRIAFSWNLTGQWEIYVLELNKQAEPEQVTEGEGAKFAPRWSPDGSKLAYVLDLDGGENYDIHLYDPVSGEHTNSTPGTHEAITTKYYWSPDGRQIAYCGDRQGRFDTYIIPAQGGEPRLVFDHEYPAFSVFWSPDGARLAVICEAAAQDWWTYIVDIETTDAYPIALDGKPISAKNPCWSADGSQVLVASNLSGTYQIGLYEIETRSMRWLTHGPGEKEFPDWLPADDLVTYVTSHGPDCWLTVQTLDGKVISHTQIEPGVIYSPTFKPGGKEIVFVFDNPRHPCDFWSYSIADNSFTQLTQSLPDSIDQNRLVMPRQVTYPSLDGASVPGLLYQPNALQGPAPAVVNVHGGPNWLSQITWDPFTQHMVSRGWIVLAPNYRGSTGYGKSWQLGSRFDLGGVDTRDVVAGANYLEAEGLAIPEKIAVTGRSWGGYLTMTCLTQYPKRWAAGSASVPFLNWFTSHKNSREDLQHWDRENFGDPEENYDLWYNHSPYFFLDKITAPVQLLCGENDVRCPASESHQAAEELERLGKEVDYVLFEDEGHVLLKMETQVAAKTQRVAFMAKALEAENEE